MTTRPEAGVQSSRGYHKAGETTQKQKTFGIRRLPGASEGSDSCFLQKSLHPFLRYEWFYIWVGDFALDLNSPKTDQLFERILAGSDSAADALLNTHRKRLRKMVAARLDRRLQARFDPSDIVQDVLCEATQQLPKYLATCRLPFYPWLRQIAWDRLVKLHNQHLRVQKRSVKREISNSFELSDDSIAAFANSLPSKLPSPSALVVQAELHRRLRDAIETLGGTDREVVLMHYVEQMTLREIAASLELSDAAAKSRHIRALQKLARQIGEDSV